MGQLCVVDEQGEDCNYFEELKSYKLNQAGHNPHTCTCGTKLVPKGK
jgi:hypothetical protein